VVVAVAQFRVELLAQQQTAAVQVRPQALAQTEQ
jgi:hypothetical protein